MVGRGLLLLALLPLLPSKLRLLPLVPTQDWSKLCLLVGACGEPCAARPKPGQVLLRDGAPAWDALLEALLLLRVTPGGTLLVLAVGVEHDSTLVLMAADAAGSCVLLVSVLGSWVPAVSLAALCCGLLVSGGSG